MKITSPTGMGSSLVVNFKEIYSRIIEFKSLFISIIFYENYSRIYIDSIVPDQALQNMRHTEWPVSISA